MPDAQLSAPAVTPISLTLLAATAGTTQTDYLGRMITGWSSSGSRLNARSDSGFSRSGFRPVAAIQGMFAIRFSTAPAARTDRSRSPRAAT